MQIIVQDHYENIKKNFVGDESSVRTQLLKEYPWLQHKFGPYAALPLLVQALDRSQVCSVKVADDLNKSENPLHYINLKDTSQDDTKRYRSAGKFLSGNTVDDQSFRSALISEDGDVEAATLFAYGLDKTFINELRAITGAVSHKTPEVSDGEHFSFKTILPTVPSSLRFAETIKKANDTNNIKGIQLGSGKHSKGTLIAIDFSGASLILKPGSGPQNPALGENENPASQSQREACFYAVAHACGLAEWVPEAHLVTLDGKMYAAMSMLPDIYSNFNDINKEDPAFSKRVFLIYNNDAILHKWAALDYICGNPDRHAGNIMCSNVDIKLIDHGSAFAGEDFNPPVDQNSFFPYYLRASCPSDFNNLTVGGKLKSLPRVSLSSLKSLRSWVMGLNTGALSLILEQYGIQPDPSMKRLERIQNGCGYQNADLAILSVWIVE